MSSADTQFIRCQPLTFAVAIGVVFIAPGQAMFAAAATQVLIAVVSKRVTARR